MGALSGVTGLLTTGLSLMGGAQQRAQQASAVAAGDYYQSWNEKIEGLEGYVKASQTNTAMTQHLMNVTANINAVRAAAGEESGSPTGEAVLARTEGLGNQDIQRQVQNINEEAMQHMAASSFYQQSAQQALNAANSSFL